MDISTLPKLYHNTIGKRPITEGLAMGAGMGALGYYGSKMLLPQIAKMLMAGKGGKRDAQGRTALDRFKQDGSMRRIQLATAAAMGLAGMAYPLIMKADTRPGKTMSSWFSGDHWERNPEEAERISQNTLNRKINRFRPSRYEGFTRGLEKNSSWDAPFSNDKIPVSATHQYLSNDSYLSGQQKGFMHGIVDEAANGKESGIISGKDIARGAMRAGVGYGTAYILGQTMGKIFDLPEPLTDRLSHVGGFAGAIINTGVFGND